MKAQLKPKPNEYLIYLQVPCLAIEKKDKIELVIAPELFGEVEVGYPEE